MLDALFLLLIFTVKAVIIVALILFLLIGIVSILSRGKNKLSGAITVRNLTEKFNETKENLLAEILPKDQWKKFLKEKKLAAKAKKKTANDTQKNIFVLNFNGDIKASAVAGLREEVTAILGIATPRDEVVLRLESAGGMVHAYGLAAAELARIRQRKIPLTIAVDKIAASGGYMMACIANKILAAPFAIIGSIGVIVQIPNFHRLLKEKRVDFEQLTAGNFKRTLTVFGENTKEGREKMQQEIEEIHHLFQNLIQEHRPQLDIKKVSTGEHWLGTQALQLQLVDELKTSDDYLLAHSETARLFEVKYHTKKSFAEKLTAAAQTLKREWLAGF